MYNSFWKQFLDNIQAQSVV